MFEDKGAIGLVGCGAIGSEIALAISLGEIKTDLAGVWDTDIQAARRLSSSLDPSPPVMPPAALADNTGMLVECAGVAAVPLLVDLCLSRGIDLMVMSIGGLTQEHFQAFENSGNCLYIPSGAICGLDGIIAYAGEGLESITLTTRKPPAGLKGAKYIEEKGIDLDALTSETIVFEGAPSEAIKHFPKNINVSTALAIASSSPEKVRVRIVADPASRANIHEISVVAALGSFTVRVENKPSPSNPKTSALAYLSAIATLKKIYSNVKIGT